VGTALGDLTPGAAIISYRQRFFRISCNSHRSGSPLGLKRVRIGQAKFSRLDVPEARGNPPPDIQSRSKPALENAVPPVTTDREQTYRERAANSCVTGAAWRSHLPCPFAVICMCPVWRSAWNFSIRPDHPIA
jgi:hypothetical protein